MSDQMCYANEALKEEMSLVDKMKTAIPPT